MALLSHVMKNMMSANIICTPYAILSTKKSSSAKVNEEKPFSVPLKTFYFYP
ncbi:hypothetical protein B0296_1789 [Bifidobacterium longum subsp. longum]|nr:hypothetical protein B0296_1789 [Bifidobacterium longum subsp. longum]